jgi:hypothetical protein
MEIHFEYENKQAATKKCELVGQDLRKDQKGFQ